MRTSLSTLNEVAKRAGVSYTQASFVLNKKNLHCVSAKRQSRIREAMADLNYRPNRAARQMKWQNTRTIGFLLSAEEGGLGSLLPRQVTGINQASHDANYFVSLLRLFDEQITGEDLPHWVQEICIDGLLLHYNVSLPAEVQKTISSTKLPLIWLNDRRETDCVYVDEVQAGRLATQRLLHAGHRRVAFVNMVGQSHHSLVDRCEGYQQTMQEAGLTQLVIDQFQSRHKRAGVLQAMIQSSDAPTAMVAGHYQLGLQMRRLADQRGLTSADFGIASFVDEPNESGELFDVHMVLTPQEEVGRQAAANLIYKIENSLASHESIVVKPSLLSRPSLSV